MSTGKFLTLAKSLENVRWDLELPTGDVLSSSIWQQKPNGVPEAQKPKDQGRKNVEQTVKEQKGRAGRKGHRQRFRLVHPLTS